MKKLVLALLLVVPALASAQQSNANIGSCGWGSRLFKGENGMWPQVLAVTTNGTSGNQTFGISSGTSGCTTDGVVTSNWKTAAFIDSNMNKLAFDMSRGEGESLDALATLVGVSTDDRSAFASTLQANVGNIFPTADTESQFALIALKNVLAADSTLSQYSAKV